MLLEREERNDLKMVWPWKIVCAAAVAAAFILTVSTTSLNWQTYNWTERWSDCCSSHCKNRKSEYQLQFELIACHKRLVTLTVGSMISNGWFDLDVSSRFRSIPNRVRTSRLGCREVFRSICCANNVRRFRCTCTMADNSLRRGNLHHYRCCIWIRGVADLWLECHVLWLVPHNVA